MNATNYTTNMPVFELSVRATRYSTIMARQEDTVLLTGLVGKLSYYKTKKGGYFVRRKSGVSRERIMSDPAFASARENIAEFRRATLAAKLIRRTFAPLFERGCDKFVSSRLTGRLVKVIQGDTKNQKGQRRVMEGNVPVLAGFGMNRKSNLSSIFRVPFATSIDRIQGTVVIDIPSFMPAKRVASPPGATHYRLRSGGAAIDFETDTFSVDISETNLLPVGTEDQAPLQLMHRVASSSPRPIFAILGIEFLQIINGTVMVLQNHAYNAMAIIMAEGAPPEESRSDREGQHAPRPLLRRTASLTRTVRPPVRRVGATVPEEGVLIEDDWLFRKPVESGLDWEVDSS